MSDTIRDSEVLPPYVSFFLPVPSESTSNDRSLKFRSLFDLVLDDDSRDNIADDEVTSYLKVTGIGERTTHPLLWWKANSMRYSNISSQAREILANQATSVASESSFSNAVHLVHVR